ncbi:AAA family ATPase [Sutcliffiella horikoshii]|uniref:AAA family ATPase n=1 Tax=Sutcliffiella horikoshii TaxID=79883 RepID=UPI00384CA322
MKFYKRIFKGDLIDNKEFPCVILTTDDWDDNFKYETLFHAYFYASETDYHFLGDVKVATNKGNITRNYLEDEFYELDESFFSLGQDLDYYRRLRRLPKDNYNAILYCLRDIATNDEVKSIYSDSDIFRTSLIRFSKAQKAYNEAKKYFGQKIISSNMMKFTFSYEIENADEPHVVELDFNENELPYRINAFVGKNATGKTKILTELSSFLSGVKLDKGNFVPERPLFDTVIGISYSAFDELYKPFEDKEENKNHPDKSNLPVGNENEKEKESEKPNEFVDDFLLSEEIERTSDSKLFSYVYCGLRNSNGVLSIDEIENNFFKAYEKVKKRGRIHKWERILKNVLEEEHFYLINRVKESRKPKHEKNQNSEELKLSKLLSSGQNILISTMTEVVANIEYDSILLFDEPELHLHPNAISNFMRMIYEILTVFKSYAIISTHSPLIIQEIPSRYVRVFNRIGNYPYISTPSIECFGENITNITNDVFDVREFESNYKSHLRKLYNKKNNVDGIHELFPEGLSFNAMTYLNSLSYISKEEENN